MSRPRCGSVRGYMDHRKMNEPTCQPCRDAKAEYGRQRDRRAGVCKEDGCELFVRARGWCGKHLARVDNHGRPDLPGPTEEARFWSRVVLGPIPVAAPHLGECWLWTGPVGTHGYGKFSPQRGRHLLTHRWAFEALRCEIPEDLQIDHLCRVKTCVNPWHHDPVTGAENLRRMHRARKAAAA